LAERRMFSKTIIDSDAFLDMPLSTQALYFHLSMRADDDGFVNNPIKIMRMINASRNDMDLLIAKRFVIAFESGIIVIRHWRIHNYIKSDRYKPTQYLAEKSQISISGNKAYEISGTKSEPKCIQSGTKPDTQVRLELGKDRLGKRRDRVVGEETPVSPAADLLYEQVRKSFIENCPSLPKPNTPAKWTNGRRKAVRDKKITPDEFTKVFKKVEQSDFLTGRSGNWRGCSFDWILKPSNWQKITEGNYDNREKPSEPKNLQEPTFDLDEYEKTSIYDTREAK